MDQAGYHDREDQEYFTDGPSDVVISDTTLKEQEKQTHVSPQTDKMDILLSHLASSNETAVNKSCNSLAYRVFIPWLNKQNYANKLYFAKKGGVKLCVKWMNEATDESTRILAGTAVWNFAESGPMYEILWREGAVEALFRFLDSNFQLQRVAVGALFGLLDYDRIFKTHLNLEIVGKILAVESPNGLEDWAFRLGKSGCIVCLAKNAFTRDELIRLGGHKVLLEERQNDLLAYLSTVALAHLVVEPSELISQEDRELNLKQIELFMSTNTPLDVRKKEREVGVVWKSFTHFKRLFLSPEPIISNFGLFCLANLSYGDYNRTLLSETLIGELLCFQWAATPKQRDYLNIIFSNYDIPLFPSLSDICRSKGVRLPNDEEECY